MAKWADYLVSAVRFNAHGTHIDSLRCHADNDTSAGPPQTFSRKTVVDAIKAGKTFVTVTRDSAGDFRLGQRIQSVTLTYEYLKTRPDSVISDNLDELPKF